MSRKISEKQAVTLSTEETALRNTATGKLLFTEYAERSCGMLIQNDRMVSVCFTDEDESKIGAIYLCKVKNIAENINACFVEIADKEICFLPLKDAAAPFLINRRFDGRILAGDEFPVQIVRDAQKTKQASVTARISLSNDYFALELGSHRINYSTKLTSEQKEKIRDFLEQSGIASEKKLAYFKNPASWCSLESLCAAFPPVGLIVRTKAGECAEAAELSAHFEHLAKEFVSFLENAHHRTPYTCLKEAPDSLSQTIQQLAFPHEFNEIVTDDKERYEQLKEITHTQLPEKAVRLYEDESFSLKKLYSLDTKMEMALNERVWLKSGAYLVIQPTEAMTVIDVNSGKYDARKGNEETALKLNLEAAEEVALQLRLRNLSGIIVVDFINMKTEEARQKLLKLLRVAVNRDKLHTTVVDMTPLGLVELTRKKERKPLYEQIKRSKNRK